MVISFMSCMVTILFIVLVFGSYYGYKFGMHEIGVQKGYAPTQPIAYSHKLHAGDLKIDCKYCHVESDNY